MCGVAFVPFILCLLRVAVYDAVLLRSLANLDQNNDDPMLDYGAAVAIKFASSRNAVKGMTPLEYGTFLRNDPDHVLLVDNASCAPAARAKVCGKRLNIPFGLPLVCGLSGICVRDLFG